MINFKSCSATLIQIDSNWEQNLHKVWQISRPLADNINTKEILKIDTPILEFVSFIIRFDAPVFIRDIFCSLREHVVWARTTRVEDVIHNFNICSGFEEHSYFYRTIKDVMRQQQNDGIKQDQYRMRLPLTYMTTWSQKLSLREIGKLVIYFQGMIEETKGVPQNIAFRDINYCLRCLIALVCDPDDFISTLIPIKVCDDSIIENIESVIGSESITEITIKGTYSLRSQLIRHRGLTVIDDYDTVLQQDIANITIGDDYWMKLIATNGFWSKLIMKRNCWLAQSDMWYPVIQLYNANKKDAPFLVPCLDGVCKYQGDCEQRLIGKDPGLPCPRHINLHNKGHKVDNREMRQYILQSRRPPEFWGRELSE